MKKIYLTVALALLLMVSVASAQEQNITERNALDALLRAEKDIEEMIKAGFGTAYVNDTLIEAKKAFEGVDYKELLKEVSKITDAAERERAGELILEAQKVLGKEVDYSVVLEKTKIISDRKQQAYDISDSLRALELSIDELDELKLNTTKAWDAYASAQTAFQNERYDETEEFIAQAYTTLTDIRAEATLLNVMIKSARENIVSFVKENWPSMLIAAVALSAVGYAAFDRIMIMKTKRKMRDLEIEQGVLVDLMKKAQAEYFQKQTLPKETYEIKMKRFKERMLEIKEIMPVLEARLEKKAKKKS